MLWTRKEENRSKFCYMAHKMGGFSTSYGEVEGMIGTKEFLAGINRIANNNRFVGWKDRK